MTGQMMRSMLLLAGCLLSCAAWGAPTINGLNVAPVAPLGLVPNGAVSGAAAADGLNVGDSGTVSVDGRTWEYEVEDDGSATVMGVSPATGAIEIPSDFNGRRVTGIVADAFCECLGLTSVTIPDGVTEIGECAFSGCSGLTNVTIGTGVTDIGDCAFDDCSSLKTFTVDADNAHYKSVNGLLLTKDGGTLIAGVNGDVIIPDGVTSISDGAFDGRSGLISVVIPDGVTSIDDGAFFECHGLTSVVIPGSVTYISAAAFGYCSSLQSFTVDSDNAHYKSVNGLLLSKDGYTLIVGANGDIVIPDGVTRIDVFAFVDRSGLTSVDIPDSVSEIDGSAFEGCSSLRSFTVDMDNEYYRSENGLLLSKDGYTLIAGVNGDVVIPDGVEYIGWYAFDGRSGLTSVVIPDSVTRIDEYVFDYSSNLKVVNFKGNAPDVTGEDLSLPQDVVLYIQEGTEGWDIDASGRWRGYEIRVKAPVDGWDPSAGTPSGVTWLHPMTAVQTLGPNGLDADSPYDFYRISMTAGWAYTFETKGTGDTYGELFSSASMNGSYRVAYDDDGGSGCNFRIVYTPGVSGTYYLRVRAYDVGTSLSYTLAHSGVADGLAMGESGTVSVDGLTWEYQVENDGSAKVVGVSSATGAIEIPSNLNGRRVTGIGDNVFSNCDDITSVVIPDGVTRIDGEAFIGCSGLTGVTIPDSVTGFAACAFDECASALYDTTTIPGVRLVDGWAVGYCDGIPSDLDLTGVRGLAAGAFWGCDGLTNVTIPNSVTEIGDWTFESCSGLTSVIIPNSVTNIGWYAFSGCSGLMSVVIPDGVTSVGESAFSGCTGLKSVAVSQYVCSQTMSDIFPDASSSITNVIISDSVTSIGRCAFSDCYGLTNVTIGVGVTSIGESAFGRCGSLTSVTIPDSVTSKLLYNISPIKQGI